MKKHYNAGRMQDLQKKFKEQDVVWLMVVSSPEGRQGYMTAEEAGEVLKKQKASPTALLFDSDSATAQSYGALTTPHMYLINPAGQVVYQGAIDDKPSTRPSTLEGATPFLAHAVQASLQGEALDPADTKPYGCAIKYKN